MTRNCPICTTTNDRAAYVCHRCEFSFLDAPDDQTGKSAFTVRAKQPALVTGFVTCLGLLAVNLWLISTVKPPSVLPEAAVVLVHLYLARYYWKRLAGRGARISHYVVTPAGANLVGRDLGGVFISVAVLYGSFAAASGLA